MSTQPPDMAALFAQFLAQQQVPKLVELTVPNDGMTYTVNGQVAAPGQHTVTPAPTAAFSCKLNPRQRETGNLCGKEHCQGCKPYRTRGAVPSVPKEVMAHYYPGYQPMPTVAPLPPAESAYIDRTTHEVLLARAVREGFEVRQGARRDLFIAAALQGLIASGSADNRDIADVAGAAVNFADAVLKVDGGGDE